MVLRFSEWARKIFSWVVRHYNRLEIQGIEHLPSVGSAIISPNHSGGLDYDNFTIMSALEHFKYRDPARKRIWLCYWDKWSAGDNIWARWVQKFSPIPINLEGKGIPYSLVDKIVEKGEIIAIMPEGHSAALYEGYQLWRFYPGLIKLHLRYKIPIIPTAHIGFVQTCPIFYNKYNQNVVPPWEKEMMFPFPLPKKIIIHFGKPMTFEKYYGKQVRKETLFDLAAEVRARVKELIENYRTNISATNPLGDKVNNKKK